MSGSYGLYWVNISKKKELLTNLRPFEYNSIAFCTSFILLLLCISVCWYKYMYVCFCMYMREYILRYAGVLFYFMRLRMRLCACKFIRVLCVFKVYVSCRCENISKCWWYACALLSFFHRIGQEERYLLLQAASHPLMHVKWNFNGPLLLSSQRLTHHFR